MIWPYPVELRALYALMQSINIEIDRTASQPFDRPGSIGLNTNPGLDRRYIESNKQTNKTNKGVRGSLNLYTPERR
jgi:hypothetical protein